MNVGSALQQELHHVYSVVASSEVQRRAVPALQITAVHRVRVAEFLHKYTKERKKIPRYITSCPQSLPVLNCIMHGVIKTPLTAEEWPYTTAFWRTHAARGPVVGATQMQPFQRQTNFNVLPRATSQVGPNPRSTYPCAWLSLISLCFTPSPFGRP